MFFEHFIFVHGVPNSDKNYLLKALKKLLRLLAHMPLAKHTTDVRHV